MLLSELARFARRLISQQGRRFITVVFALTTVSLLEGLGVAALVPLLTLVEQGGQATDTGVVGQLFAGLVVTAGLEPSLTSALALVATILFLQQLAVVAQHKVMYGSVYKYESDVRRRLFSALLGARWEFFISERTSDLVNALTVEVVRARQGYVSLTHLVGAVLSVIVYALLALTLSWQMTLVVLGIGVGLLGLLRPLIMRGARFGTAITDLNVALQREANESLSAAKVVKGSAAQERTVGRFVRATADLAHQQFKSYMNQAWLRAAYDAGSAMSVLLGVYIAATYVGLPLSLLVVFLVVFYRLQPRLSNVQVLAHQVLEYLPASDSIEALTDRAESAREATGGMQFARLGQGVVFDGVEYGYSPSTVAVRNLNLVLGKGQVVGVVGPSGAGKTTVVDLLMRLVDPREGRVLVDGVSLQELDVASWRSKISYVSQDGSLFHASVKENIEIMAPDATAADIERAIKDASAADFLSAVPGGLDAVVGDRGLRFSGGQRQRVALASAFARRPDILVLDEATSALDAESERAVLDAVHRLDSEMTVVIVTHRLSGVRHADHIYLMDQGQVVEEGDWQELVAAGGRFAKLAAAQELGSDDE